VSRPALLFAVVALLVSACAGSAEAPPATILPSRTAWPATTMRPTATARPKASPAPSPIEMPVTPTPTAVESPSPPPPPPPPTPPPTPVPTPRPVFTPRPTGTPPPDAGHAAAVVRIGNTTRSEVAFSFDAGSDAGYTSLILDTLLANGIKASFGMTGRWAERNPGLLRRIVNEGHHLINHTYDHASFTGLATGTPAQTQAERWGQLERTETIIRDLTGATTNHISGPLTETMTIPLTRM